MERLTTLTLSFVSGFIDTAGFIALSGLFTAHVTGNLVLAGAALLTTNDALLAVRLLMLPVFMLGAGLSFALSAWLRRREWAVMPVFLWLEGGLLIVFSGVGTYLQRTHPTLSVADIALVGSVGVLAMSLQNSYMRLHLTRYVPTTVMTGNITQFSVDLVEWALAQWPSSGHRPSDQARQTLDGRLSRFGLALLGFLLGAGMGAVLVRQFGLVAALLPAGLVLLLTRVDHPQA